MDVHTDTLAPLVSRCLSPRAHSERTEAICMGRGSVLVISKTLYILYLVAAITVSIMGER